MGKDNKKRRANKKRQKQKRLKQKNAKNNDASSDQIGPVFTKMPNPLSHITDDQRKELVDKIGEESKKKFEESISAISTILKERDPITLISVIAGYSLAKGVTSKGVQSTEKADDTHQFHIEVLQALFLQIKKSEVGLMPIVPEVVQQIIDELKSLGYSFSSSRFSSDQISNSKETSAIQKLQEIVRLNTQAVRNWGHFSQVNELSYELYSYFDKALLEREGISVTQIFDVFNFMLSSIELSLNKRFNELSDLKKCKNTKELIHKYFELIERPENEAENYLKNSGYGKLSKKKTFFLMMAHYDLRMSDYFIFRSKDISEALNISVDQVTKICDIFSLSIGELQGFNSNYILLDNPVWEKPITKLEDNKYFCPVPQLFFSFILSSLNGYIESVVKEDLHDRRANYLEDKINKIVNRRFPDASTVVGVKWNYEGTIYETDLITFIDSYAIIIEAKSHKITKPANRGAPDRLKRHIKEVLIEPSIQSKRFKTYLETISKNPELGIELKKQLPVDLSGINKVIRVSVSLEAFSTLQTNLGQINDTGWIPEEYESCPTMTLADFETVFDILEHPVQIIHYLTQRTELEKKVTIVGDELDFLGLYFTTLLNMNSLKEEDGEFMISGMSEPIDRYYNSRDHGVEVVKPKPQTSKLFKNIFLKLEERSTPRWSEIGVILNMFTPDDQVRLESSIRKYSKIVNRTWEKEGHTNTIVVIPAEHSDLSLAFLLYKNGNSNHRDKFIQGASELGLDPEHVKNCLVIAKNIDDDTLPYHFIALFKKD